MDPAIVELLMASGVEIPVWRPRQPAWHQQAACRGVDPNLMVPRSERDDAADAALSVCADCAVRSECLAYALKDPNLLGVWGGTTSRERRELRAQGAA